MKTVAVLGGGPAGAFAAAGLASAGIKTLLFDEKLAWEKPCGGGLTYKAYCQYPFLLENDKPKRVVHRTVLGAPKAGATGSCPTGSCPAGPWKATLDLDHPLVIYSRSDLNGLLLERAARAGAAVEKTRVLGAERRETGPGQWRWKLRTRDGVAEADFCIVATGARNPLRDVGTQWTAADTMIALGYYVPANRDHIDIQFLPGLEGYIWVFPRCGHLSVGICGKGEPAQALRARLEAFMDREGLLRRHSVFYSHMLPSLAAGAWRGNRVAGEAWLAVGDAAGLVDPFTGEGIYYAMRSGDLASQVVADESRGLREKAAAYRALLEREFTRDLEFAAGFAKRIFVGRFLGAGVTQRTIQFTRYSPRFRGVLQDLFAGLQAYSDLKKRLIRNLVPTLYEVAAGCLRADVS
jgi:flavin-dependent dehydrogenase